MMTRYAWERVVVMELSVVLLRRQAISATSRILEILLSQPKISPVLQLAFGAIQETTVLGLPS